MLKLLKHFKQIANEYSSDSVLIYQMGKVGSTSLEMSLAKARHFHTLYSNSPCKIHDERRKKRPLRRLMKWFGNGLKQTMIRRRKTVRIISPVREPYGRNVSMFFQDLPFWMVHYQESTGYDSRREGPEFLYETFETAFDHFYFDHWFDKELKRLTGIDIFEYPFDMEKGYSVIRKGRYEVMLIKLEKMDELHTAIEEFVGYTFAMQSANKGEQKWYACLYRDFMARYRPSERYLNRLYDTKTVRHFYTGEEIEGFKKRYLGEHP